MLFSTSRRQRGPGENLSDGRKEEHDGQNVEKKEGRRP